MREYRTPARVDVPPSARVTDIVSERAATAPGTVIARRKAGVGWRLAPPPPSAAPGPVTAGAWERVTAREFRDEVAALAKGFMAAGIGAGDRVALMSRTRYEWTLLDYAIWTAGAVTVPIYETSAPEQAEWILADSGARAAVIETDALQQTVAEVLRRLPAVEQHWVIEGGSQAPADGAQAGQAGQSLAGLAARGAAVSDAQLEQRRTSRGAGDLATIIYTSGTTGRPKGCKITHANLLWDARNAIHGPLSPIFEQPGASTLLFLPLAHSFARIIQVGAIEAGAALGHSTADVRVLLPDLASFKPTFILAVPRMFEKIYNGAEQQAAASKINARVFHAAARAAIAWSKELGSADATRAQHGAWLRARHALFDRLVYSRLRSAMGGDVAYAISGGAPLGERLGHFFRGAGVTILEGYGLTETSPAITVNSPGHNKIGTVGQPLPGVSVRIASDGEILAAGPIVFSGYWRNDDATAEVLDGDWLRTGDVGELDDEGFLRVTGRKKELIVTAGGKNVAPALLEDQIRAHPLISQCMVVGDNRPYIACLITLDADAIGPWQARQSLASATLADLKDDPTLVGEVQAAVDAANATVSRAEAIKRFRILAADFTEQSGYLTPSLKVRRNVVIKDFADEIDALYS